MNSVEAQVQDRLASAVPLALRDERTWALLNNLIGNATKYSPQGSRRLGIADQGQGIAERLRKRVFERFYRMRGQGQGGGPQRRPQPP